MTPQKVFIEGVWVGIIATMSILSIVQDWFGKDAWLKFEANNWVNASWTVPMALVSLVFAGIITLVTFWRVKR